MTLVVRCVMGEELTVVTVSGGVSVDSAPRLRTVLKAAVDRGRPVLVDMVAVRFIDRAGFDALVAAHQQAPTTPARHWCFKRHRLSCLAFSRCWESTPRRQAIPAAHHQP